MTAKMWRWNICLFVASLIILIRMWTGLIMLIILIIYEAIKRHIIPHHVIIIDREAREIMYLVASVCPSVRQSILGARLCRVQQRAKKSDYQSAEFVCVSNCRADAADRLLIFRMLLSITSIIVTWRKGDLRPTHTPPNGFIPAHSS